MSEKIYKVLTEDQWETLNAESSFAGSPDDIRDGFIHLAKPGEQLDRVLTRYFSGDAVVIVQIDASALGDHLKWESEYPHLYDVPLLLEHVLGHSIRSGT